MSSLASRANPLLNSLPHFLTWRALGFRTICSGRLGFAPSDPDPPHAGTKVLETFKEEFEIGSRLITLETGKIARFANGSVVLGMEGTKVLATVTAAKGDSVRDFLPLTVDYQEKQFARCVIPNTFMRREGSPKERELLCGRIIDRPIRPLFPVGFYHEVQVMASVLSSDGKQDPDVMAANATSVALMLSDIPWGGPIGVIRIGRICGQFIVNPTMDEDKTLMIDVQAREILEKDLEAGLRLAHPEAVKYLEPQIRLAARAGKNKKDYKLSMVSEKTLEEVRNLAETQIESVFTDSSYGKFERGEALDNITQDVRRKLEEDCDEESLNVLPKAIDTVRKQVVRRRIISEGFRVDGRRLDEVRPLYCEAGNLPLLHGSSLFSRGDTQVLCAVTLGGPGDAQRMESLVGPPTKRFMLHYSFPPFSINEVGKRVGLNRREVGHGTLAEKALLAVLPPEDDFPYTVRVNSEVMASDGSTSMATVCGGSMALMDAGIPLQEHVAGVSVGLVSEVDPSTGEIKDYRILTDILGLEDHLGDMDFKIAGTRNGVTAIQLDIKPAGIPLDIICECLEHARKGRHQILDHMEREISAPRTQDDRNRPRIATLKFSNDVLRQLIGPLGAVKTKIEEETGARLSVSDGTLTIIAKNQIVMEKAQEKIDFMVGREIEIGGVYKGIVTSIKEYGAFIEFNGGQQGLLHISELSHEPVSKVSDVVSVGQQLSLMCIGRDVRGNIKLSLKATLLQPGQSKTNNVAEGPVPAMNETPKVWASVESVSNEQDEVKPMAELLVNRRVVSSTSSSPALLIRSVEECDEEEKSAGLSEDSNITSKTSQASKRNRKSKTNLPKNDDSHSPFPSSVIFSHTEDSLNNNEAEVEAPISAKNLKLGTKVTAKIYQIRRHGLVLDLGGGVRAMYRFETNGKREFELGNELRVKCTSFSSKGVPIMSLVDAY
ncbi:polyribonucleotide nucleotidyltransferase 2, mitochondrial isoform X2 [Hevea brasiliensis]|uniref:polyribonucleotide nucleotidyltransferase 2, mitochondrial isoform X2 n=2 Tax=Hevea brasiliensis TaxID=3981 RepID=UPI0025FD8692|nr:polyribonucleotide nucleotidyltransferase 2, mitochondrial isoform X2 [Hevea brasiliensis]